MSCDTSAIRVEGCRRTLRVFPQRRGAGFGHGEEHTRFGARVFPRDLLARNRSMFTVRVPRRRPVTPVLGRALYKFDRGMGMKRAPSKQWKRLGNNTTLALPVQTGLSSLPLRSRFSPGAGCTPSGQLEMGWRGSGPFHPINIDAGRTGIALGRRARVGIHPNTPCKKCPTHVAIESQSILLRHRCGRD